MDTSGLSQGEVERTGAGWATECLRPLLKPGANWEDTNNAEPSQRLRLQSGFGDYIGTRESGKLSFLEVKTERRHTGNLFLETWSNRTTDAEWRRDGWMFTLGADLIAFVFLDAERLYLLPFLRLREWAMTDGEMYRFPETVPHLSRDGGQKNTTVGHCVPLAAVRAGVPVVEYRREGAVWVRVKQLAEAKA